MIKIPSGLFRNKGNAMLFDFMEDDQEEDFIVLNEEDYVTSEIDEAIDCAVYLREPEVVEYLNKIKINNKQRAESIDHLKKEIVTYIHSDDFNNLPKRVQLQRLRVAFDNLYNLEEVVFLDDDTYWFP